MDIHSGDLINDFLKENDFPVDSEEAKLILTSPWRFLSDEFDSDEFNKIRFRYFGVFSPIKSRIKDGKDNIE